MILGIGIDISKKERIKKIFNKRNDLAVKFAKKILHPQEFDNFLSFLNLEEEISFLSKRFAVKEALSKAIGTGIFNEFLSFSDINIIKDKNGTPIVEINEKIINAILFAKRPLLQKTFEEENLKQDLLKEKIQILISISDEKEYSVANAVVEVI